MIHSALSGKIIGMFKLIIYSVTLYYHAIIGISINVFGKYFKGELLNCAWDPKDPITHSMPSKTMLNAKRASY